MKKNKIHPTAVIDPGAELDSSVCVGAYSVIEKNVQIDADSSVDSHTIISGPTKIGKRNKIGAFACIGAAPQDMHYQNEPTSLTIGDDNWIREYASLHRGSPGGRGETVIGNNNLLMAYCHVAHDCQLADHIIMVNNATLGGHVEIGKRANIGGMVAVHQFTRIGRLAIIGRCSKVVQDVPPFSMCDGHPAKVIKINSVGLKRAGISSDVAGSLKKAFKVIFRQGLSKTNAIKKAIEEVPSCPELEHLIFFIKTSDRGLCS